ncbi:odorant receptor 4-like [Osmia lignaria lignaria]|uniref:odorant receptor 4-like n=1 Tax=Osmia lignaria lignaria TaxID=1437193 RepID=UPI0014787BA0|nr:odorant receptor 67c-like [Osmia lignaria]
MMISEPAIIQTDLDNLFDYSLQLNRWFLKPIGAWPASLSTSKIERIVSLILIVICYCSILATVIPCILYVILDDDAIQTKLMVIGPLSHWFVGGINYTTLLLRSKEIQCCVQDMQNDWYAVKRLKDLQVMIKNAKFGRYVVISCAAFMQGGVLCYCVITGITTEIIEVGNETRTIHLLPCAAYTKLFPVDTSPTNEIMLIVQCISGFIVNSSTVGAFSLAIVFATHAYGQLNVLMMWITELVKPSRKHPQNAYLNEIGVIVENHLKALSFVSHIEDMMNEICFWELFKCTFNICMLGYYVLMHWANRDFQNMTTCVIILCSMAFNIFLVCYIGEKLSEQCKKVGEAVYMTEWYYLPDKYILDLLLIISRSSVAIKMTAGKFVQMSLITFSSVIKTAFAYLNVLRQTT